ncbi:MAG: septum formation protein Maf [Deltaproteobacteria bacterium]|nr:MAG: septum formation protein Maf [Deltaproteobacteria bacterium]
MNRPLILASTSVYRSELMQRLGLPFEMVSPGYEERADEKLSAPELALCHAIGKAREVSLKNPDRIVIGSDQVAEVGGQVLGKPYTVDNAIAQLERMSGREVSFHTGVALVCNDREESLLDTFTAKLRVLSRREIESYIMRESPLDCAGSFKVEGLGIALMDELQGRDFTSLIGLPLISLTKLLISFGVNPLTAT